MKRREKPKKLNREELIHIYKQILSTYPFLGRKEENLYKRNTKKIITNREQIEKDPIGVLKKITALLKNPHADVRVVKRSVKKGRRPKRSVFKVLLKNRILYIRIFSWGGSKSLSGKLKKTCHDKRGTFDALIIDVRGNGGGNSATAHDFAGIFFQKDVIFGKTHVRGRGGTKKKDFVLKGVGKKYLNIPIVILIDEGCFSSNELFIAPFKIAKRATLVGQTTAGGSANPVALHVVMSGQEYRVRIPRWRFFLKGQTSPIEKTKIKPDIKAQKESAEEKAFSLARKEGVLYKSGIRK